VIERDIDKYTGGVCQRERDIEKEKCGEIEISILALCVREGESMCA